MDNLDNLKERADAILYGQGLLAELEKYGKARVIGSYLIDAMAWPDLDIDVENEGMTTDKLYGLTRFITERFAPCWYEAKREKDDRGRDIWFHGFEAVADGMLWNVDIWFFDRGTVEKAQAFCLDIRERLGHDPRRRAAAIAIKQGLLKKGLYSFEQFTSLDVYKAVLEEGVLTAEEFLRRYKK